MGKNSNVHKSLGTLAEDLRKEREMEEKKALKRRRREMKMAEKNGEMLVEAAASTGALGISVDDLQAKKTRALGKIKLNKAPKTMFAGQLAKKSKLSKSVKSTVQPSLELKKRGIRKPSAIMRKTMKKMARERGMELD